MVTLTIALQQHCSTSRTCLVNRTMTRVPVHFLTKEKKKIVYQLQGSVAAMKTKNYLWREVQGDKQAMAR